MADVILLFISEIRTGQRKMHMKKKIIIIAIMLLIFFRIAFAADSSIVPAAASGKIDGILADSHSDKERRADFIFSGVLSKEKAGIMVRGEKSPWVVQRSDSGTGEIARMDGKRIGTVTGSIAGPIIENALPHADILYFENVSDILTALKSDKIDAMARDDSVIRNLIVEGEPIIMLNEYVIPIENAALFPKTEEGQALADQYSEFLRKLWADGTIAAIDAKWFDPDDSKKTVIDYENLPDTNGKLIMAVDPSMVPFTYIKDNRVVGYEVEIAAAFCEAYAYRLEILQMSFGSIIPAVLSGKADFASSCFTISPERTESVTFSEPVYRGGLAIAVLAKRSKELLSSDPGNSGGTGMAVPENQEAEEPEFHTFSELNGKTVSMVTGAPFEELIRSKIQDVGGFSYFSSMPDIILALKSGKTDAALSNNAVARLSVSLNPGAITLLPENLQDSMFGIAFAKGDPKRDIWQAAYDKIPESEKQALWDKWTGADESLKVMPEQDWPGLNGTVQAAVCDTLEPMSYAGKNGVLMGFDLEMILLMAKELDVHVEFTGMEFSAILASVQSGKSLIGAGSIIITEERAEAVDFVPYYPAAFVLVVRTASQAAAEEGNGFLKSIRTSFEKTFIRENRWKLILMGIRNTLLITVLSVIFGTVLGFLLFMICRNGNPVTNGITNVCLWLVQGMPMVVLLMILFYVIFGSVIIDGIAVAIIGFTLTFGASVFGLLKMGVGAVDRGQFEAACALGYSDIRTFFRIILPQAIPHVIQAYKGEINGLLKATAIVGYIAVQDLTKMGDIIRSRTYEAFFPLIAVTVIYFLLEMLLGALLNRVQIRIDPKRRKPEEILKGVQTHDQN